MFSACRRSIFSVILLYIRVGRETRTVHYFHYVYSRRISEIKNLFRVNLGHFHFDRMAFIQILSLLKETHTDAFSPATTAVIMKIYYRLYSMYWCINFFVSCTCKLRNNSEIITRSKLSRGFIEMTKNNVEIRVFAVNGWSNSARVFSLWMTAAATTYIRIRFFCRGVFIRNRFYPHNNGNNEIFFFSFRFT